MIHCVLDSSAVLAFLLREPGCQIVGGILDEAAISAVNVAEVVAKLRERGVERRIREAIRGLSLAIIDFNEELAYRAGEMRGATRHAGLSLGDRACLATAQSLGVRAVTADRKWSRLKLDVRINLIR